MPAKQGDSVKVHYTGKFDDGQIFDTSEGRDPLEFTVGQGHVINGFENAVIGMEVGEEKTIHVPSAEAYGGRNEELIQDVPRDKFAEDMKFEIGQGLQIKTKDGHSMVVLVKAFTTETITLDANHPLAGKDLNFDIKLVEIVKQEQ